MTLEEPAGPAIRYSDRVFVTGMTGSGKSHLARSLYLAVGGRRLVVDPADSDLTLVPGAVTFSDPLKATNRAGESWRDAHHARFVPDDPDDLEIYSTLFRWVYENPPRWVWIDEGAIVLPSRGGNPGGRKLLLAGRKRPVGMLTCNTRPRHVQREAISEAAHVFMFRTGDGADRRTLAENLSIPIAGLEECYGRLQEHGYLWWDLRRRKLTICSPLGR